MIFNDFREPRGARFWIDFNKMLFFSEGNSSFLFKEDKKRAEEEKKEAEIADMAALAMYPEITVIAACCVHASHLLNCSHFSG